MHGGRIWIVWGLEPTVPTVLSWFFLWLWILWKLNYIGPSLPGKTLQVLILKNFDGFLNIVFILVDKPIFLKFQKIFIFFIIEQINPTFSPYKEAFTVRTRLINILRPMLKSHAIPTNILIYHLNFKVLLLINCIANMIMYIHYVDYRVKLI